MINCVFMLPIVALLVGCNNESTSTQPSSKTDSMQEAFVELIQADQPGSEIKVYEAKVVGDLGVLLADLHPGGERKSATVYMHFKDGGWVHVKRVDVWSNNPRYLYPRMRVPDALHSDADKIDSWVLEQIRKDVSTLWLAEQGIIKREQD